MIARKLFAFGFTLALLLGAGASLSLAHAADPANPAAYVYGTPINFIKGGNSGSFTTTGWSVVEEQFTWTEGTGASLVVSVPPTTDAISLQLKAAGMVRKPDLPAQPVEVFVNEKKIAEWQVSDTAPYVAALPSEITKAGGTLTISFKTPKAVSPKAIGASADERVLGICCFELALTKTR